MGKGNYRWRETKKPKKGEKKISPASILPVAAPVEVVKRKRKEKEEEGAE